jgi:hypothetical protein
MPYVAKPWQERFWRHVQKLDGLDACWHWTGYVRPSGYGQIMLTKFPPAETTAHRASWLLHFGEIPTAEDHHGTMVVCHRCDNPRCVRPDHLFLGTQAENVADMDRKGRRTVLSGTAVGTSRYSEATIREVERRIALGETQGRIAAATGTTVSLVKHVRAGRRRGPRSA